MRQTSAIQKPGARPVAREQTAPFGREKRRARRVRFNARVSVFALAEDADGPETLADMFDISATGVCIDIVYPMRPGDAFGLLLPSQPPKKPVKIRCRVCHCRKIAEMFRIGAEFIPGPAKKSHPAKTSHDAKTDFTDPTVAEIERIRKWILA